MNIEEIIKRLSEQDTSLWHEETAIDVYDLIDGYRKLEADKLEMAKAYCYGSTDINIRHKAQQYIKEKEEKRYITQDIISGQYSVNRPIYDGAGKEIASEFLSGFETKSEAEQYIKGERSERY